MKKISLLLLFCLMSLAGYSQDSLFYNLQGLYNTYDGNQYFELAGTSITIFPEKATLDTKGIKKVKKNYKLKDKNIVKEYKDNAIDLNNLVIEGILEDNKQQLYTLFYLFPKTKDSIYVIQFQSMDAIDQSIVKPFVESYLNNTLSKYVIKTKTGITDSLNFVGRTIALGGLCRYMGPNNVQCPGYGQMNWAIFNNREDAELYKERMMEIGTDRFKLVSDTTLNSIFEYIPTPVRRRVYKAKFLTNILIRGKNLCVYYVTQRVRGRYVTTVLSYYMNNESDFELAPLLKEVMSLQDN